MKNLGKNRRRPRTISPRQAFTRLRTEPLEARRLLAVFTVTNVNNDGDGSLRESIELANANPGLDVIDFDIPGAGVHAIIPTFFLPPVTDRLEIHGETQPGYTDHPLIELDGTFAGNSNGLEFHTGGNYVEGLDIHSFTYDGLVFAEPNGSTATGSNTIVDNYLGTDPTGTIADGNGFDGVHLVHSPHDLIEGNLISGNTADGVFVADKYSTDTHIVGNLIGTDVTGLSPLGNGLNGVDLSEPPSFLPSDGFASGNYVGGTDANARNIIAGNNSSGVYIHGGQNNVVQGNYIGLGADGLTPVGNGAAGLNADPRFSTDGIFIDSASNNVVGGTADGAGNVISGNASDGVRIDASDLSASDNAVQGNRIGTDKSGSTGLFTGNHHAGIEVQNDSTDPAVQVSRTLIGGADLYDGTSDGVVKARNIISGNVSFGIAVIGHQLYSTAILGNYIGTGRLGLTPVQNGQSGVEVAALPGEDTNLGPWGTIIGDYQPGSPNIISGNQAFGVSLDAGTNTTVERNLIGVNAAELSAVPNGLAGVSVAGGTGVIIGGLPETEFTTSPVNLGNIIAGNTGDGIEIRTGETGAQVISNFIGLSPLNDKLGNGRYGVLVSNAPGNTIGGTSADAANYIGKNSLYGIVIAGQASTNNVVEANDIGVMPDGTPEPNGSDGILISNAPGNIIGGILPQTINVISSNVGAGIQIDGPFSVANRIIGNYIGTDPTGTTTSGNSGGGVLISGAAAGNFVGGAAAGLPNVISGNLTAGISIFGGATGNKIINNAIGTDLLHENPIPNVGFGISIVDAAYNIIGGTDTDNGNAIFSTVTDPDQDPDVGSGHGISISGAAAIGNQIAGNTISGNHTDGIRIGEGASLNVIGDATSGSHNLISANLRAVSIESGSFGNDVINNYLGTDDDGNAADDTGNTLGGVALADVTNNIVQGNTIRDNPIGVGLAFPDTTGNRVIGNVITNSSSEGVQITRGASGNVIGGTTDSNRNVISANLRAISIDANAHGNSVIGNYIGTDENGDYDEDMGNTQGGIALSHSAQNTIQGNTIRGNPIGVGMAFSDTTGNKLVGNIITQSSSEGIQITQGASSNVIGGSSADDRNLISVNQLGVSIEAGSQNNSVLGNYIGTNDTGAFEDGYGNRQQGVAILDSGNNTVRGNTIRGNVTGVDIENAASQGNTVAGNVITNNTSYAVRIVNGASANVVGGSTPDDRNLLSMDPRGVSIESESHDNQVIGNYIGTDASGHFADGFGDTSIGVGITDSYSNDVDDNTIRGNQFGVGIKNAPSINNRIQGNIITNSVGYGVLIASGASDNVIGGPSDGDGNQISQNGDAGVWADSGTGNAILRNAIFANAGLGIDLAPAGVTANDPQASLDGDTGPNNLQNFPVLTTATTGASQQVSGTLSSAANTTYLIQLFNLDAADPSGNGQGDRYLTTTSVTTNASGMASFNVTLPNNLLVGTFLSATATDANGNTSEFSAAIPVEQDSDGDGISDETENGVPNDDVNDDGIPDSQEGNVVSFQSAVSGQYVTLESPAGTTFTSVSPQTNPSPSDSPNLSFDQGFFGFTLSGVEPGAAVDVQVILQTGSAPVTYFRYGPVPGDPTPQWYDWSFNGQTGAEINGDQITLHFVDGQFGDDDLAANGTIVDPGGPAYPFKFTVTNTNDDGPGSLRQAITDADNHPGNDLINFNIPGGGVHTIVPLSELPAISDTVTIDGTTQPGFAGKPLIELDGEDVSPGVGLIVLAFNTTIRGLDINRFLDTAIGLYQGASYAAYNFSIVGNYLGTDPTGTIAEGNGYGVAVFGGSGTIGGTSLADQNVISGNSIDGIYVYQDYFVLIEGNLIGVGADGTSPLGNAVDGVRLDNYSLPSARARNVAVGGLDPGEGNVIAFNQNDGIEDTSNGAYSDERNLSFAGNNLYFSNLIYGNGRLGISENYSKEFLRVPISDDGIDGQDLNDGGGYNDGYSSPQNYPVLASALNSGGETTISGYLDSRPYSFFTLQFFSNPTVTPSGYGQGKVLLGTITVETDENGHVDFTADLDVSVANGQLISATASSYGYGTSDFSERIVAGDVLGNTYIVNSTDDTDDGAYNPAHVTLRDAILAANAHPGLDTIQFAIGSGVQTIAPLVALPVIIDSVIIDGTTQPGFAGTPLIQIVGTQVEQSSLSGSPSVEIGLFVDTNGCTVKGLDINSFFAPMSDSGGTSGVFGFGIIMDGNDNVLEGCFIGTDVTGTVALPNLHGGEIFGAGNRIGGTTAAERNVISGNVLSGLAVGAFDTTTDTSIDASNLIEGNYIGTDLTGTLAVPNGQFGNEAYGLSASGPNIIGGAAPGAGNVISANGGIGLGVAGAQGTVIQGNFIGTDVTGTKKLGNLSNGLYINDDNYLGGPGVLVGGTQPGEGNIVSSNGGTGIIDVGFFDVIQGNLVGTDITGTLDFGNGANNNDPGFGLFAGIAVLGSNNLVGGSQPGAGNLISGNFGDGIYVQEDTVPIPSTNVVQGNRIGTQVDGISPLGNGGDGVYFESSGSSGTIFVPPPGQNIIGGTDPGAGNIIAFNGRDGVTVYWYTTAFNFLEPVDQHVAILSNLIYANGSLGIDLGDNGVTANDPLDADLGSNDLQNFPVLATVTTDGVHSTVTGSFNGTPNTVFQLQFFSSAAADPSGYGEGQNLLGTRLVTTDSNGNATFVVSFPVGLFSQSVSATATDILQSDTSEFSAVMQLGPGPVAPNQPPAVSSGGPYTINEGSSLTLSSFPTDDPDGDTLAYSWDVNGDGIFGDATGANPALTWTQLQALGIVNGPSSFTPRLRVDDGQGHIVTSAPTTLSVLNVAPTADAGPDLYVNEEDTVSLTGTFTDPGTADTHTLSWHVDADNGQVIADGTDSTFSFVPDDNGTYVVTFTVTDSDGDSGVAVVNVYVSDVSPEATIVGVPAQGTVGVPIHLSSTVTDVSSVDTAAGFQYYWQVFAENNSDAFYGNSSDISFTPTGTGIYDVYLYLQDKDGGNVYLQQSFVVVNSSTGGTAPTVTLGANSPINEGDTYSSSGSFTDPDVGDSWTGTVDYGDGSGVQPLTLNADKSFNLSHVYGDNGGFDVTVAVTDSSGSSGTQTTHVTVNNVAPAVTLANPSPVAVDAVFSLAGSFTDPGDDTWTAKVNYGDGTGDLPLVLDANKTFALSHTYQSASTFNVVVTVTDDDGGVSTATVAEVVNKLQTSLTANPASATYGGTTTLSATLLEAGSPAPGKTLIFSLNGSPVGSAMTNASGTATLNNVSIGSLHAGSAAISVAFAADGLDVAATAAATLSIAKAPLTITAVSKSKAYGAPLPALTASYLGFVNGDGSSSLTTQPQLSTTATAGGHVAGSPYAITASGAVDADYTISYVAGTLSVTPVGLTITAADKTKLYGAPLPALTASYAGFVNGDGAASLATQPVLSTAVTAASHVNTYAITASGAVEADYTISYVAGSLSVTPVGLTITAADKTKLYGAPLPALTASYAGFVNGDGAASLTTQPVLSTAATAASHVNSYAITANGAVDADYTIKYVAGTLSVTPVGLTITAADKTKLYGAPLPALTASYAGFVNGDGAASLATQPVLSTAATAASHVNTYTVTASGAADADYTIAYQAGTLSVTPAPLTFTLANKSKLYGAPLPALTETPSGFVNGDTAASLTTQPVLSTTATAASHVGSYPITASGAADADYTFSYVAGSLSVTPVGLTVTAESKTKPYGAALPTLTASYLGFVNGDSATSLTKQPTLSTTATAASHVTGSPYAITASGAVDSDYTIAYQAGTLSVTPVALTITAANKSKVYGAALPALTASYLGFVNGDGNSSLTTQPQLSTTATSASAVLGSPYAITVSGAVDSDYTIGYVLGSMSVTPAPLTIKPDDKTKVAGAANPTLTFTATGLVNGDLPSSLTTQPTLATTATTASPAGPYPITASGAASPNYTISYVAGTLTVTAAAAGGSISGKEYFDVTGNGLSPDDTPLAGVKVYLDANNNGSWNTGEPFATTLADGSYTLTGLGASTYKVREVVPSGYVRTAPATSDFYSVTLASGQAAGGNNFANAQLGNSAVLSNIVYVINGVTPVSDLRGATHEGDTIQVSFTVVAGSQPQRFTLVSYTAPGATYDANTAAQQQVFDSDSGVFGPGTYTLSVSNPHSYFQVDFVGGYAIDKLGPATSNIFYTAQTRLFSADNGGAHALRTSPSTLSGTVYLDTNNNGTMDAAERPIAGVPVTLTCGSTTQAVVTDIYGVYTFDNLPAGAYTITESQPGSYSDGKDTLGNKGGTAANDKFTGINLTAAAIGSGYNFGEQQTVSAATAGNQTQTAAWWNGTSGQALIKALNGGQTSKTLGNWLAANFNNLFGADAGTANNLTGKTNAQVAAYYQSLDTNAAKKPEADTLALALNIYVTNSNLAGNTAASYGFAVSTTGLGSATANVAAAGAAFGINNNTVMTIAELLSRANARARKGMLWDANADGVLSPAESILRNQIYALFETINNT